MIVGFTGTRHGMTKDQLNSLNDLLIKLDCQEIHLGDCVGSDDQAADLAYGLEAEHIICHPPTDPTHRAFNKHYTMILQPKSHFARNRDIVDNSQVVVGTPDCRPLADRGGTAYTVRYSIKKKKSTYIIWPNGEVELF